jgi:hypothetical protein
MSTSDLNLEGLTLSDEGLTLNLDVVTAETQILDHFLIGRVLTDKQVRFNYFKERMAYIWRPVKKVTIALADTYRFLFQFNHCLDATKVIKEAKDRGFMITTTWWLNILHPVSSQLA